MTCPKCGSETSVVYTLTGTNKVCRKRKCKKCSHIMYTTETAAEKSHYDYNVLEANKRYRRRQGGKL